MGVCVDEHKSLLNCINDIGTYNLSARVSMQYNLFCLILVFLFFCCVVTFVIFLFPYFDIILYEQLYVKLLNKFFSLQYLFISSDIVAEFFPNVCHPHTACRRDISIGLVSVPQL